MAQIFLKLAIIVDLCSQTSLSQNYLSHWSHWSHWSLFQCCPQVIVNHCQTLLNMACMSAVWLTGPYKWATLPNSGLVTNPLNPELVRDCEGTLEIWRESDPAPLMRVITTAIALLQRVCVIRRLQLHFILGRINENKSWFMKDMLKYTNNRYVNKCIIHNSEHFNDELRNIEIKRNTLLALLSLSAKHLCLKARQQSLIHLILLVF